MAGAGRRIFQPGEVLTASNTMNYLMDQAVMSFAGTAARGSAIGTAVSQGMTTFLKDTNKIESYTGSGWSQVYPAVVNSTNLPAGSILQVVQAASVTTASTNGTAWSTANLSATITPTSTSSMILIICHSSVGFDSRINFGVFTLFRGTVAGTNLGNGNAGMTQLYPAAGASEWTNLALTYMDSPATTSATTYTLGMKTSAAGGGSVSSQNGNSTGIMMLLEVKG